MISSILATIFGIIILLFSANIFVTGASNTAKYFNIPSLLIGILIVGLGTSMPELVVSFISAVNNAPGIAIGNAYGSNIANIALILGVTAIISPVYFKSQILKKELPILTTITLISLFQILDKNISRADGIILLVLFLIFVLWLTYEGTRTLKKSSDDDTRNEKKNISIIKSIGNLIIGITLLIASSKLLVWGATQIAQKLGVSDVIIGLTVVAIGTSLPELASSIIAAKKNEHDLVVGNILGSNIFNTLACIGSAGIIMPFSITEDILKRDMGFLLFLTISLFLIGYGFKERPGRVNRLEGGFLAICYVIYTCILILNAS